MGPDSALGERTQWRVVLKGCEAPTFYCVGKVIWGGQVGDVIPSHAFLGERVVPQEGVATSNAGQAVRPSGGGVAGCQGAGLALGMGGVPALECNFGAWPETARHPGAGPS